LTARPRAHDNRAVPDDAATFLAPAELYDAHVGRYGAELAAGLIAAAGVPAEGRALDVGCGPGALTRVLAERLGPERVAAAEPSEPFATACAERIPGADVRVASAEDLPFADGTFDAVVSQLVVNFVPDQERAIAEMARVARPGGLVAASVWDYAGGMTLLRAFWDAALVVDPEGATPLDEGTRFPVCSEAGLRALWEGAGLREIRTGALTASASYDSLADLWRPLERGVGPSGAYAASLPADRRAALRDELGRRLGAGEAPFTLDARAWWVAGRTAAAGG
jgi:SAM-dependent methyltransferase